MPDSFLLLDTHEYSTIRVPTQFLMVACPLGSCKKGNIEVIRKDWLEEKTGERPSGISSEDSWQRAPYNHSPKQPILGLQRVDVNFDSYCVLFEAIQDAF
jgi:hypothetical protein